MAKKSSSISLVYGLGMLLAAIGFCLPIFQFKFLGTHAYTGFDLVGDGDTAAKIFTLLVFVGAVCGVVAAFLPKVSILKPIALAVSFVSFVIVIIMMCNSDGASFLRSVNLGKKAAESVFKSLYDGAYMIFAGWIVACAGLFLKK